MLWHDLRRECSVRDREDSVFVHLLTLQANAFSNTLFYLRILNDPTWSASLRGVSGSVNNIISENS